MVASAGVRSGRAPALTKYEVLEELGHGGMATVYRALDPRLGRDVAVKVLHPHLRESQEIAHRFSVEARAVAKLRHPNIVEVFDVSTEQESEQYLVVELVRGPTLRKMLQERGAFPPEIAAAIVLELLSGVAHAHSLGVVHRDVKPENVLVEHRARVARIEAGHPPSSRAPASAGEGERVAVKLTDFGIAKLLDAQGVTSTGQVLGSPAHMAPEQIEGGDVDGRADVFGLGVLLYECMVGQLPFRGNNPAQVLRRVLDGIYEPAERERPTVGKTWSQILDHALARKPEARFDDAPTMRDTIAAELARLGMGAPRKELEAWLDDPEGWTTAHDKRLIDRLCQLGAASRKHSDAVAAAADYNRALAYAPNDPSLLRIVASMHRAEARARLVRRIAPLVLGALVLGSGAYFVARALKHVPRIAERGEPTASANASGAPSATASVSVPPSAIAAPSATVPVNVPRTIATPIVTPPKPGAPRSLTFASIRPYYGVHLTVDGAPVPDPDPTRPLTLDDRAHTLHFTCRDDLCVPKTVQVAGGENNVELSIELAIVPARLLVEGDPSHSYGVTELHTLSISAGSEVELPMTTGTRQVHVFDRSDPTAVPQEVTVTTGKRTTVSFKGR